MGRCGLLKACYLGNVEICKFLVDLKEIQVDQADINGRTPLHNAAFVN